MNMNAISHELNYTDSAGRLGVINISLSSLPSKHLSFPDGTEIHLFQGEVAIKSEVINYRIVNEGETLAQLIYRLLCSADVYVQTRFAEAGFQVFKVRPGDVDGPMDIYS